MIIDFIYSISARCFSVIEKSKVWGLFLKFYAIVASWWEKGCIMGFAKTNRVFGRESIAYKVFTSPFTFLNWLNAKISPALCKLAERSGIVRLLMNPIVGVFAVVILAPFLPTMVVAGLCIFTGFMLVVKYACTPGFKWKATGVGALLMAWLVIMLISCFFSYARGNSLKVYAMYFVFVGFFFVAINSIDTKDQLLWLCKAFVWASLAVALYGIAQYVFGWTTENAWIDETMFEEDTMRVYSTLGNPNVLGEYLLLAIPLSAIFMVYYKKDTIAKWFYGASFIVLIGCLVLTQSRGCWLGFFLAAIIFVCFYNGKLWAAAIALLALVPFLIPQSILDRLLSVGNMDDTSTSYRVFIWMGVFKMLRRHLLGGIGMGEEAFGEIYQHYSYNTIIAPHSHNTFLQITVESGIVSLIVFVAAMALVLRLLYMVYHKVDKTSFSGISSLCFGAGLTGFLLQSLFDYTFYNYRVLAIFFVYIAMAVSLYLIEHKEEEVL